MAVVLHAARQGGVRAAVALALFPDPQDMMMRWLVHARQDTMVPLEDAQRLQAVLRQGEALLVDGDHDLHGALEPHAGRLVAFPANALASEGA